MPIHVVQEGETLLKIARQHNFIAAKTLYNHPDNAQLRALRPNPDLLAAGDEVFIPESGNKSIVAKTRRHHILRVCKEQQWVGFELLDYRNKPMANARVVLNIGNSSQELFSDSQGKVQMPIDGSENSGSMQVYEGDAKEPLLELTLEVGKLDPVDTLAGVQSRCNALGYDCGVADGINGSKTRSGVKAFQAAQSLDVDGVAGPMTKAKLKTVYGR